MATAKADFDDDFEFPDEREARLKKEATKEDEDKLEVEIEDDTPPQDRGRKPMKEPVEDPTEDELASYDEKVQQRIKKFTRGYHDERRAKEEALREREAAEAFARKVLDDNKRLQHQLSSGSKQFIETSQNAAGIELEAAKKKFKEAYEAGDSDLITEAQAEIAQATLKLNKAKELQPIEVDDREFEEPSKKTDNAPPISRRTQRWLQENNDWWGKDEEMTAAAMGLDKKLQREYGSDYIGSDEYFKTIDRTMRKRFPEFFSESRSDEDEDLPPQKRSEPAYEDDEPPRRATKPAAVVAPANRSTPPNRIRLKQSEAAIARRLGVPLEEYARQVAQLKRG
jgi:hypothetical protein